MTETIHLIAVGGTGMGTLACMLKTAGYRVTGSDLDIYPPMSDQLNKYGISVCKGYRAENLDHQPDLVVIGNAVSRNNPEASAVMDRGLPYLSMPQAVNRFFAKNRKIILVCGTHGKTTTSAVMAHLLYQAGLDPSFMIGGVLKDFDTGFRLGNGPYMVIEGDEYDTAFFDKESKFLHYDPFITILTGIEFDHADIFTDLDHVKSAFLKLLKKLTKEGLLIASSDCPDVLDLIGHAACRVSRFGAFGTGKWTYTGYSAQDRHALYDVWHQDRMFCRIRTPLIGEHNASNFIACAAAAHEVGIDSEIIRKAMSLFPGIRRRQEIRGIRNGITVMDDFAHHPTAVAKTIEAVRPFYSNGRVIAVFEPRTNTSMRKIFQHTYPKAFAQADLVCIAEPSMLSKIPAGEQFSSQQLVQDINSSGIRANYFKTVREIIDFLKIESRKNDLILVMSNGAFDHIHHKLLETL